MLVLSRRENQKIFLPGIGVTIEVLRIRGQVARIGIEAPPDIHIVRAELADQGSQQTQTDLDRRRKHALRNRFHTGQLALQLARRQLASGLADQADTSLQKALDHLQTLEQELGGGQPQRTSRTEQVPCRALLVEDDANESELLSGYLRLSGLEVDTADHGADALSYLSSHDRPDVVLLDMLMPRCDGPTTVAAIRGNPLYQGLKIFAVSGTEPGDLGLSLGPKGVDRWFRKPLDPEKLVQELARELASSA